MWPLMSVPASGSRAFRTALAAFWCKRCSGGAAAALKVSSRKATPTPSVPPTSFSVAGVHGLPLTISANRASRTRDDLAVLRQTLAPPDRGMLPAPCVSAAVSGSVPKARPKAASTLPGVDRSRTDRPGRKFWPWTSSMSRSPMKRLTASQKSSRTMTTHCTRSPSHCRRAGPVRRSVSSCLACSHCSNWSRTIKTFWPSPKPCPWRRAAIVSGQVQVARQARTALPQPFEQPGLGVLGGGLDVNRDHLVGQAGQQTRPSPATICRNPRARRSRPP